MEAKRISQDFWLKGTLIVIESVPAGVCPQCGEKIVTAEVGATGRNFDRKPQARGEAQNHSGAGHSL